MHLLSPGKLLSVYTPLGIESYDKSGRTTLRRPYLRSLF